LAIPRKIKPNFNGVPKRSQFCYAPLECRFPLKFNGRDRADLHEIAASRVPEGD